jgi:hypothetical protein
MKTNKSQDFDIFFTDKNPNIVSQYDFWTKTIFTSLKLSLKRSFFGYFLSEVLGPSVARFFFPGQTMIKNIL